MYVANVAKPDIHEEIVEKMSRTVSHAEKLVI